MASVKCSEESVEAINKIAKAHKLEPIDAADKVIRYGVSRVKALTGYAERQAENGGKKAKAKKAKPAPTAKKATKKAGKKKAKAKKAKAEAAAPSSEEVVIV